MPSKKSKPMRYFNGNVAGERLHGYIAARSKAEALRLGQAALGAYFTRTELDKFWSEAWGRPATEALGLPDSPGVWIRRGHDCFFRYVGEMP